MTARWQLGITLVTALLAGACSTGEGEGAVRSDKLFIEECWNGPFDLQPTFFAANPSTGGGTTELRIRVQRGDNIQEVSDGLAVLVTDVNRIRGASLGQALEVGLPPGVSPPGVPIEFNPDPPLVSLALYLHDTCHLQNSTIYAISGSITFQSLFSGDPNESSAEDRLTDASFTASFADPRDMQGDRSFPADRVSDVAGYFRFYFQRGQPAQPFP